MNDFINDLIRITELTPLQKMTAGDAGFLFEGKSRDWYSDNHHLMKYKGKGAPALPSQINYLRTIYGDVPEGQYKYHDLKKLIRDIAKRNNRTEYLEAIQAVNDEGTQRKLKSISSKSQILKNSISQLEQKDIQDVEPAATEPPTAPAEPDWTAKDPRPAPPSFDDEMDDGMEWLKNVSRLDVI